MVEKKCEECGTIIPNGVKVCPECGCPVGNESESVNENTKEAFIHNNFNEKEPYSPFKADSWFFKDPWPMSNYPIGELDKKHPFIGWLVGPWYLTCKNPKEQEEYNIINNIFYFFNLIFKTIVYTVIWQFFKIWWIIVILGLFVVFGIKELIVDSIFQSSLSLDATTTVITIVGFLVGAIWIAVCILGIVVASCAMGKALHRYWPQLHRTFRKLNKRYWDTMLDK